MFLKKVKTSKEEHHLTFQPIHHFGVPLISLPCHWIQLLIIFGRTSHCEWHDFQPASEVCFKKSSKQDAENFKKSWSLSPSWLQFQNGTIPHQAPACFSVFLNRPGTAISFLASTHVKPAVQSQRRCLKGPRDHCLQRWEALVQARAHPFLRY